MAQIEALVDRVPESLLVLNPDDYATYWAQRSILTTALSFYIDRGSKGNIPLLGKNNEAFLVVLRNLLAKCPDSIPPEDTTTMGFIENDQLRAILEADLSAAYTGWANDAWKSATVLAGSIIEALLLWVVQKHPEDVEPILNSIEPKPKRDRLRWTLAQLIEAALNARLIDQDTAAAASQAKNYRNLIHPGRAQRTRAECSRSTAMLALGAAHRLVEDLTKRSGL